MQTANHSTHRPRVLQLSYACSPVRGSEAGVGWQRALQSAKHFDTWVICEEHEFAGEIRQYLETHGDIPGLHFAFVPIDQREWSWGQVHDALWYVALRRWHREAYRVARRLHNQLGFDLAHQVTFCGYREPGYLWKLNLPFVWGPIGGTQNYPWRFLATAGIRGAIHETCRTVMNNLQLRLSPRVRSASRRAAVILAANSTVQRDFARAHGIEPRLLIETGLAAASGTPRQFDSPPRPLRILWSGLLIHRKALHLLIEALATLPQDVPYELRVLGDGPLRGRWSRLADRLGVAPHIEWLGRMPHSEALRQYEWADLFAFTSLRDTSGNVVLEALAAGVPVVCLDHQGMRDIVTDQCGVRIPVTTPRNAIARLSDAIVNLSRHPSERERLSQGAIRRAGDYLWSHQEDQMTDVYRRAKAQGSQPVGLASTTNRKKTDAAGAIVRTHRENTFGILMYHRIAPTTKGLPRPTWNVTPERFRRQLQGLLSRGYRAWPLQRMLAARQAGETLPARTFAVTFDDGYECVYHHAWPILKQLGVPATVFMTTSYLDAEHPFASDDWPAAGKTYTPVTSWKPLSTAHCIEMIEQGLVEIGSHTHTHADYRGQSEAFRQDLARSVQVLHDALGVENPSFAFPFGYYDADLLTVPPDAGMSCALTVDQEIVSLSANPFCWGRFQASQNDTSATLALKLNGWYSAVRNVWHKLRRPWRTGRELFAPRDHRAASRQAVTSGKLVSS